MWEKNLFFGKKKVEKCVNREFNTENNLKSMIFDLKLNYFLDQTSCRIRMNLVSF